MKIKLFAHLVSLVYAFTTNKKDFKSLTDDEFLQMFRNMVRNIEAMENPGGFLRDAMIVNETKDLNFEVNAVVGNGERN